jgi:hypothetical protein
LGTTFLVETGENLQSLTMTSVRDHGPAVRAPRLRAESFTLVFQPSPGESRAFEQGTYVVRHPSLGAFSLFLVSHRAAGKVPGASRYSATFSRI